MAPNPISIILFESTKKYKIRTIQDQKYLKWNHYKSYKLDLHGTFYRDVNEKVHNFIGKCIVDKAQEVEIITGNSDRMKELVKQVLGEYNLKSESPIYNNGTLIINMLIKL